MTVQELIDFLSRLPRNLSVTVFSEDRTEYHSLTLPPLHKNGRVEICLGERHREDYA